MRRTLPLLVLGLILAPTVAQSLAQPATPLKAGTYEVVNFSNAKTGGGEVLGLVKITPKDGGGVEGELLTTATNQRNLSLKNVAIEGGTLRMTLQRGAANLEFEGRVPGADADSVRGSFVAGDRVTAGRVTFTDKTEVASATVSATEMQPLRDAFKQLRRAGEDKATAAQVADRVANLFKEVQPYGSHFENDMSLQVAEVLAPQTASAALAVEHARRAEKALTAKSSADHQLRVLNTLALALQSAGKSTDATPIEARVAKIVADADREYLVNTPPFKPATFEGRKAQSNRAVVMELFTGAQCPPCVASDVAFDALEKAYKPTDLVLLQYHQHIPGADPMTNRDSVARWDYYRKHFASLVTGTPTVVFNGKPQRSGGGNMNASENLFKRYRGVIDPLLEEEAKAGVTLGASRQGDTITLRAEVSKLPEPGEDKVLRFVLAEESVRFIGSNRLRYHHMVVRAMPGGHAGIALTQEQSQHTARINLAELRQELGKYLDWYAENGQRKPFPQPERPLALTNLKAVALVQDEKTQEILQAVLVDIGGERAGQ